MIGSGGRGLHPFVIRAVIVFWSRCIFFVWSPFSPCISHGLSPVCVLMSSFRDSAPFALAMSMAHFSVLGGCIAISSGV